MVGMARHTHGPGQQLQSLWVLCTLFLLVLQTRKLRLGPCLGGVDLWGLPSFPSVLAHLPSDGSARASGTEMCHQVPMCAHVCASEQVCWPVSVQALCMQGLLDRGWGTPPQRGEEGQSCPVLWACDLCTLHSSYQPLAMRALSSWGYPVVGPLPQTPQSPWPTPWGTHTCAAGAFLVAVEPHQLLHHVLGNLQVLVTVTGLGTEGVPRPGEAPSILPPTASHSLQL